MPVPPTNRGLYQAVRALQERHRATDRTLEQYLRALWSLASPLRDRPALPIDAFVALLADGFTAPPAPLDAVTPPGRVAEARGFALWDGVIRGQIRDLRAMEAAGTLDDPLAFFGVNAPGGGRWYNLDPLGYLEGAAEGTFGGWEPEDGGRVVVPGPVAVVGEDGRITSVDPSEIGHPVRPLPEIGWDDFARFLENGQWYE